MAAPDGDGVAVWSADPAPVLAAARHRRRCSACRSRRSASSPPTRAARSAASSTPSTSRCSPSWPCGTGRPVRLVLTLEETFQAVRRGAVEIRVRTGFRRDGTHRLPGHRGGLPHRRLRRHRRPGRGQGQLPGGRAVPRARRCGSSPGASSRTPCPSTAFRGFGNPQINWAVESQLDEAARPLGIDPLELRLRNLARPGRGVHPGRHAGRRRLGAVACGARRSSIGWGSPLPEGRGRGIAVGIKSGPTTGLSYSIVRLLADGSVVVYAGTSDMGQGARTVLAQIAAERARRAARLGDGRDGRHGDRAVRPADVGEPVDRPDGQRRAAGLPRHPGEAAGDGGDASTSVDEADRGRRPRRGPPRRPGRCRSATS